MAGVVRVVFVGRDRKVWPRLILYLVTFGISRRVWLYRVNKELDGHEALALNHTLQKVLLIFPVITPSIVTAQTAMRTERMMKGSDVGYGKGALWYLLTWIPIAGNMVFMGWTQARLNAFWRVERQHPEHGFEIDLDLSDDPEFVLAMHEALQDSFEAGSRFDRAKERRREKMRARFQGLRDVREERARVRAAGGSTPVLPFMRPKAEPTRRLSVTCGRCEHGFDVERDPLRETVLLCPNCGLQEVIPSLRGDPLAGHEHVAYAAVKVDCPDCNKSFHANRRLDGPTELSCPQCGHHESLPAPDPRRARPDGAKADVAPATRKKSAAATKKTAKRAAKSAKAAKKAVKKSAKPAKKSA